MQVMNIGVALSVVLDVFLLNKNRQLKVFPLLSNKNVYIYAFIYNNFYLCYLVVAKLIITKLHDLDFEKCKLNCLGTKSNELNKLPY